MSILVILKPAGLLDHKIVGTLPEHSGAGTLFADVIKGDTACHIGAYGQPIILAIALAAALIGVCTAMHYGALRFASQFVTPSRHPGHCLAIAVAAIVLAHTSEALLYAAGFWVAVHELQIGDLVSSVSGNGRALIFMDYYYFSLVNFTTLGRGDLMPDGHLRFMTAMAAFHGFLLITASGTFVLQIMSGKKPFPS